MDWCARLLSYLHAQLPSAESLDFGRLAAMPAGASNDTAALDLRVTCDGWTADIPLVLRPQRADGILAPYDVGRQFRVMRALARTAVPVPAVCWHEPGEEVLGTPFFFMQRVRGETLPLFWYGPSERLHAAAAALATIHAVDWRAAGLSFLLPGSACCRGPKVLTSWTRRLTIGPGACHLVLTEKIVEPHILSKFSKLELLPDSDARRMGYASAQAPLVYETDRRCSNTWRWQREP